jgi:hypothetical protein
LFVKTKNIEVNGTTYQIRRMDAKVGSYLVFKIIGGLRNDLNKSNSGGDPARGETTAPTTVASPDGENIARAVVLAALSGGLADYETHCFIQQKALAVCSRLETNAEGRELPMPVVTENGTLLAELKEDVSLVYKLEVESLVFNLSPFFSQGGLSGTVESRAVSA